VTFHRIVYVNQLPDGAAAQARRLLIEVLHSHMDDDGLHRHEIEHVQQYLLITCLPFLALAALVAWLLGGGMIGAMAAIVVIAIGYVANPHGRLYGGRDKFNPEIVRGKRQYRQWAEVRAYRVQMQHHDKYGGKLTAHGAAHCLMWDRYALGLTYTEALHFFT
jgi:hypothetical protein